MIPPIKKKIPWAIARGDLLQHASKLIRKGPRISKFLKNNTQMKNYNSTTEQTLSSFRLSVRSTAVGIDLLHLDLNCPSAGNDVCSTLGSLRSTLNFIVSTVSIAVKID